MKTSLDLKEIDILRGFPDLTPIYRESHDSKQIKVFNREIEDCRNYLSANRREFYKILMITGGDGIFTLGLNKYHIDKPTIIFIHPNEIISWQKTSGESAGYYLLFKRDFIHHNPVLKATIERLPLFNEKGKSVICIDENDLPGFIRLWESMYNEQANQFGHEAILAYMQLLMIDSARMSKFPIPESTGEEYDHIHRFFELLEKEMSGINYTNPIRLRTALEFADCLKLHPNYLNRVLKKRTGQNVSTHIKGRLLDECKALLLQTTWTLEQISYAVGFSDQPNFNFFFKKNTGFTPNEFRKTT
ncbi:AraC family transcriptional regulator [Flavobacterium sp. MAH-1]|uniref:AraC family transcriptional regulator n=1 Tax=Flavobacterium agri TaxID=2743471 RepID=A0A7Y8Y310_9FLAO|nr:helix-turn-helix domain-containing protein [Flavobacterium agri]NUY81458.1 AraC family transcriptional regulator [Flavobacterium agri]NYA71482.1 AraC family transcriptional regulator [Flavobacterium agri]